MSAANSSPPASDLAATRNIPSPRADAAQRIMHLARTYAVATADESDVSGINAAYEALQREVIASLGDGDDSARLDGLDAELRKQGASWRSSFRAWGHDFTLFEDGWHVAVDAISDPIIEGADLRSAIDAARTAPGGANAATR